jgi:hypothetical protein
MPVDLVTIPDVELVSTGTYRLASGETTSPYEEHAAAVEAAADPTVPSPRVKLGHSDPRFAEAVASGELDGEPAFGVVANLRLSEDRQTVVGDLVDVPAWLADAMPSSYPGRSIEGGFGFEAPSGRTYELVISSLALLGVTWPGVTSLADLREILEHNGEADAAETAIAAAGGALTRRVRAGLDVELVRRRFVDELDSGEYAVPEGAAPGFTWWPRSLRFEDDGSPVLIAEDGEGNLYRVAFAIDGNDVTFEAAEQVVEQYVPVSAGSASRPAIVAGAWHSRAETRPVTASTEDDSPMTDEQRRALAVALGQPEDTPETRLHEIAAARAAEHTEPEPEPTPEPTPAPEATPPAQVPEGMTLVDAETLAALRAGAERGTSAAQRLDREDRERAITAAIDEGRIAVASRESWATRWERDPDGTRTLLTAEIDAGGLPRDVIPANMRERGGAPDPEGDLSSAEADHDAFMARHFPQAHSRLQGRRAGRVRVETEA